MKTIGEIKEEFSAAREADWNAICQMYETDLRSGVQKLVQQYRKKLDALEKEKLRMEQMMQFEHKYEHLGYLCGIDEINILQATYEAMRQAVSKLAVMPQLLLNDAVTIPGIEIPQVPIIKGDAKSASIAAASIVAKVTRDRLMVEYDKTMPEYGFASNKGYGSAEHIAALQKYGPTPIHRASFITHFV